MAYFDGKLLPKPQKEYVCFLDIMGMKSRMLTSLPQASNFMYKLHATILSQLRKAGYDGISLYPMMDGVYIASRYLREMRNLLTSIHRALIMDLDDTVDYYYWFLTRCSLAYGNVIHGRDVPYVASYEFSSRVGYKEQLLVGVPMICAYESERESAPMGIFIHESTSATKKWYENDDIKVESELLERFKQKAVGYYTWLDSNCNEDDYPRDKRDQHLRLLKEYFEVTKLYPVKRTRERVAFKPTSPVYGR